MSVDSMATARRQNGLTWRLGFVLPVLLLICLHGCIHPAPAPSPPRPEEALELVPGDQLHWAADDLDRRSLVKALHYSLAYYRRLSPGSEFPFGNQSVTASRLQRTIERFLALVEGSDSWEELQVSLHRDFLVYRSVGRDPAHSVLITGYYEPVIQGSLKPDEHFRYPIYTIPRDLITVDLGLFREEYQGRRLVGRVEGRQLLPYYSREEIDQLQMLQDKGAEIVYVADPVALFFLHIQGSGRIRLLDGSYLQLTYAGTNGHPYRSIGSLLIQQGAIPAPAMSMQAIRRYLERHPEEIPRIFAHNPSYVFFRQSSAGPLGSLGVPITPGRSIATDPRFFPRGGLAFLEGKKPIFARDGVIRHWVDFSRFVVNQDAGGAIRGPGRVDLYCGSGALNRITAGHLKHPGRLYFLLLKQGNHDPAP